MEQYYGVAGHIFSLDMPDGSPMWQLMDNYAPFKVDSSDGVASRRIFSMCVRKDIPEGKPEYLCGGEPENPDETFIKIYTLAGGYLFEMRPNASDPNLSVLWLDSDFSTGILREECDGAGCSRFSVDNSLMIAYALRTAREATLEMHASVIVKDGYGYLFLGQSGAGKSTHSRMWLENINGSRLLNDDNPIVRIFENGDVCVYGSPWSGKTHCYVNDSRKVGGFVRIVQYPTNEMERMSLLESYGALYESCSGLGMNTETTDYLHSTMETVLERIPFWRLKCLPDADAARLCYSKVRYGDTVASK